MSDAAKIPTSKTVEQNPINKKTPDTDKATMVTKDSGKKYKALVKSEDFKDETAEVLELVFEGQEVSEDTKDKIATLFSTAVATKVNSVLESKEEEFVAELKEESQGELTRLATEVDEFLGMVAETWVEQNKVAIVTNHKVEITEKIIDSLKKTIAEASIDLPEDKVDVVATLEAKVEESTALANQAIEEKLAVVRELNEFKKRDIVEEMTKDMTLSTKEKVLALSESVNFTNEDLFKKQVKLFAEAYAPKKEVKDDNDKLLESVETGQQEKTEVKAEDRVLQFLKTR